MAEEAMLGDGGVWQGRRWVVVDGSVGENEYLLSGPINRYYALILLFLVLCLCDVASYRNCYAVSALGVVHQVSTHKKEKFQRKKREALLNPNNELLMVLDP